MVVLPGGKSKVIYASTSGFHAVDMDTGVVQSIYIPPTAVSRTIDVFIYHNFIWF